MQDNVKWRVLCCINGSVGFCGERRLDGPLQVQDNKSIAEGFLNVTKWLEGRFLTFLLLQKWSIVTLLGYSNKEWDNMLLGVCIFCEFICYDIREKCSYYYKEDADKFIEKRGKFPDIALGKKPKKTFANKKYLWACSRLGVAI